MARTNKTAPSTAPTAIPIFAPSDNPDDEEIVLVPVDEALVAELGLAVETIVTVAPAFVPVLPASLADELPAALFVCWESVAEEGPAELLVPGTPATVDTAAVDAIATL